MSKEYFISYAYKNGYDWGFGSVNYSTTRKGLSLNVLQELLTKELKFEIVILNVLPMNLK